jgi:hypothetical protein
MSAVEDQVPAIEVVRRPAWRTRVAARAPRSLAAVFAVVMIVAGVRATLEGHPSARPTRAAVGPADVGAAAFAEAFARTYLTWDPDDPDRQQQAVARFVVDDLDAGAGVDQREHQSVLWTAASGIDERGSQLAVTVEVATDRGTDRLVVPVDRDRAGALAVVGYPALVGGTVTSLKRSLPAHDDVADGPLRTVVERALANYLAGERRNLLADLDRSAVVSVPDRPLTVESVDEITWAAPHRVAVQLTAADGSSALTLTYELVVVRRERWYVRSIAVDPTHQPPRRTP